MLVKFYKKEFHQLCIRLRQNDESEEAIMTYANGIIFSIKDEIICRDFFQLQKHINWQ